MTPQAREGRGGHVPTYEFADIDVMPCWHHQGWEDAAEWSMRDARLVTRGGAHATAAEDIGWEEVRTWKRYIRALTLGEMWAWYVDRFPADHAPAPKPPPPPGSWSPLSEQPQWEFCPRSHPDAIPVWVVGERRGGAPARVLRSAPERAQ